MLDWIRRSTETADVVMSVCTGAFLLANTGLLSDKDATTHHDSYRAFARRFRYWYRLPLRDSVHVGSASLRNRDHAAA